MGLDMYLFGVKEQSNLHDYNIGKVITQIEIGYWRQAKPIHDWFVKNVQDGVNNSATYYVDRENLKTLKKICEEILSEPKNAEMVLPVSNSLFFGRADYDEKYFYDLQKTIEICEYGLEKNFDYFVYQSSW